MEPDSDSSLQGVELLAVLVRPIILHLSVGDERRLAASEEESKILPISFTFLFTIRPPLTCKQGAKKQEERQEGGGGGGGGGGAQLAPPRGVIIAAGEPPEPSFGSLGIAGRGEWELRERLLWEEQEMEALLNLGIGEESLSDSSPAPEVQPSGAGGGGGVMEQQDAVSRAPAWFQDQIKGPGAPPEVSLGGSVDIEYDEQAQLKEEYEAGARDAEAQSYFDVMCPDPANPPRDCAASGGGWSGSRGGGEGGDKGGDESAGGGVLLRCWWT